MIPFIEGLNDSMKEKNTNKKTSTTAYQTLKSKDYKPEEKKNRSHILFNGLGQGRGES